MQNDSTKTNRNKCVALKIIYLTIVAIKIWTTAMIMSF